MSWVMGASTEDSYHLFTATNITAVAMSNIPERISPLKQLVILGFELAPSFYWAGLTLIVVSVLSILPQVLPIRVLDPFWQQLAADAIVGSASSMLVGTVIISVAQLLRPSTKFIRRTDRVRQLSYWLAIGFLVLIPLQAILGYRILKAASAADQSVILQYQKAIKTIKQASTYPELLQGIQSLPGTPPNLPIRPDQPVKPFRDFIASRIENLYAAAKQKQVRREKDRLARSILTTARNVVLTLMYFLAFASIGKRTPMDELSLLESMIHTRPWRSLKKEPTTEPWL